MGHSSFNSRILFERARQDQLGGEANELLQETSDSQRGLDVETGWVEHQLVDTDGSELTATTSPLRVWLGGAWLVDQGPRSASLRTTTSWPATTRSPILPISS